MPEQLLVKKKDAWRKATHRASKYLFTYEFGRRRRRATNAQALKFYDLLRSFYVKSAE